MLAGWATLWALLFWLSRANHPTLLLDCIATTLMTVAAAAAYVAIVFISKTTKGVWRAAAAVSCIVIAGCVAALAIRAVYDLDVGPDPRRFGLMMNIAMDMTVVATFVALMAMLAWGMDRVVKNPA